LQRGVVIWDRHRQAGDFVIASLQASKLTSGDNLLALSGIGSAAKADPRSSNTALPRLTHKIPSAQNFRGMFLPHSATSIWKSFSISCPGAECQHAPQML
jgi:hypothetical protein